MEALLSHFTSEHERERDTGSGLDLLGFVSFLFGFCLAFLIADLSTREKSRRQEQRGDDMMSKLLGAQ